MAARIYVCDSNPRMRQLIRERLEGHAAIVGAGATADEAIEAAAELEPDLLVLDFRTAVGHLEATVAEIKTRHPSTAVVVHTGVPRELIGEQIDAAGGVYSPKNEPEHLLALVRSVKPVAEAAASQGS